MKNKPESTTLLNIITLTMDDIFQDKSTNSMSESIELIEDQLKMIKQIEGIKIKSTKPKMKDYIASVEATSPPTTKKPIPPLES